MPIAWPRHRHLPDGAALYKTRCAACHDNPDGRTPPRESLQAMTPSRILRTLDFGAMMTIAYTLRRDEREAVAQFLGKPGAEPAPRPAAFCADRHGARSTTSPGRRGTAGARRATTRASCRRRWPSSTAAQVPRLKLKWAFGFEGDISAFAQPTVIGDQVFVGSAGGVVHALRADTGCLQWTFQATGPIRSRDRRGAARRPARAAVRRPHRLVLRARRRDRHGCLEEAPRGARGRAPQRAAGRSRRAGDHPGGVVGGVALAQSRLPVLHVPRQPHGAAHARRQRGVEDLHGADAARSAPARRRSGTATLGPSGVGIWSSPTLDLKRRRLYVTTGNNYSLPATPTERRGRGARSRHGPHRLVAAGAAERRLQLGLLDRRRRGRTCPEGSGPDYDFGSPAILVTTPDGRDLLLAGQKSGIVWAFDPDKNGEVVWQTRVGQGGINGGVQWGMASDGEHVYAATSDVVVDAHGRRRASLDPEAGGGLTALRIADGSASGTPTPPPVRARAPTAARRSRRRSRRFPASSSPDRSTATCAPTRRADGEVHLGLRHRAADSRRSTASRPTGGAIDGPGAGRRRTAWCSSTRATRATAACRATCCSRSRRRRPRSEPGRADPPTGIELPGVGPQHRHCDQTYRITGLIGKGGMGEV